MYHNTESNIFNAIFSGCFYFAILIFLFVAEGCSRSSISIEKVNNPAVYSMYGKDPSRDFYYNGILSDSLLLKWRAETNGSNPVSSVVVYDNYVFLNDLSGRVYCFDTNTGKTVGQLKHKGVVYTAPVLENILLIYAVTASDENNSELIYYDIINSKTVAEADNIKGKVLSHILRINDGIIFITENGKIYKYNFAGYKMFEYPAKKTTHSSPAFNNNIFVFGNDEGEITGFNVSTQKVIFTEKISEHLLSNVSISGNTAFIGDYRGVLYSIDINSGRVLWKYDTGKRIDMTPVSDNENVYVGNLAGEFYSVNKSDGSLSWKLYTDGVLNTAPLVSENLILLPDLNRKLHFVDKKNGSIKKSMIFEGRSKLSPVYFNNMLFIGYDDGILEAYEIIN